MDNRKVILVLIFIVIGCFLGYKLKIMDSKYNKLVIENNKNIELVKELTEENRQLLSKVSNSKESEDIKLAAENFLKGMFEYDEKTDRRESVREYITKEFYNKYSLSSTEAKIKYKSTYDKAEIYVTDIGGGKILARVWHSFEINNTKTTTQTLLTLDLVTEGEKYLINNMEIQGTMNEKGFLN
jgi:predicted RND superfamily exporter protein